MITDPGSFLNYFQSIHRRTLRDIEALPVAAAGWEPSAGEGEKGWGIAQIVHHIAESRIYFASAYVGDGWRYDWDTPSTEHQSDWVPALEASAAEFLKRIEGTPKEWLNRRIKMIDTDGTLSGWRILMMLLEHEVHHRSQIDTYAGLEGWDVPHIYGRSREQIDELQDRQ
ncbi:MAG: DinB family protein [Chloroflexi bacterium]|nr:DinB family protein [Chloroflexota bacterium]